MKKLKKVALTFVITAALFSFVGVEFVKAQVPSDDPTPSEVQKDKMPIRTICLKGDKIVAYVNDCVSKIGSYCADTQCPTNTSETLLKKLNAW